MNGFIFTIAGQNQNNSIFHHQRHVNTYDFSGDAIVSSSKQVSAKFICSEPCEDLQRRDDNQIFNNVGAWRIR